MTWKTVTAGLAMMLLATACVRGTGSTNTATATAAAAATAQASGARSDPAAPAAAARPVARRTAVNVPVHVVKDNGAELGAAAPAVTPAKALMPEILGASVSPTVVGSGTVVRAVVRTTPGVVSVVAFAGGTSLPVPRVGPGLFATSTTIPPLPPFAHGSYSVTFVARDARGASTQSAVGVSVR